MIDPVELTQELIKKPSITPKDEGAQDVLINALEPLGFDVFDVSFGEVRNTFFRLGNQKPHICFCGHTDVVPEGNPESWTYPPFKAHIEDNTLYGRGSSDMKGNIACFISALSAYLNENTPKGSISLLITGDEEGPAVDGTVKVLKWMKENDHIPDFAIVGEPTNPDKLGDEIKIGRRGSLTGLVTLKGTQGHVAYPHLAKNPLPVLSKLAHALSSHKFDEGNEFFQATNLELTTIDTNNKADNVIPESAFFRFNVRFNDQWNASSLEEKIREILSSVDDTYTLQTWSNAESFLTKPGKHSEIISDSVYEVTNRKPELTTSGGTSDARFVKNYCPVIECGLINKTIHQIDESAEIADIYNLTKIYQKILEKFFK